METFENLIVEPLLKLRTEAVQQFELAIQHGHDVAAADERLRLIDSAITAARVRDRSRL